MLFDQKARREEMALQDQIEQAKFARQMAIDAKNEARADEKHKLDMLTLRAGLADKLRARAPDVDTASRTAQDVTSKNFTEQDLMGDGGGQDFAGIVAQNDPTTFDQVGRSNMAEANLATQLALGSDLQMAMAPGADRGMAIDATLGAGQGVEAARQRTAQIELDETLASEQRAEEAAVAASGRSLSNSIALSKLEEQQLIDRQPKQFMALNGQIRDLVRKAENEKDPVKKAQLKQDAAGLAAMRDFELTRGQPEGAISNARELVALQQRLDLGVNLVENLKEIDAVQSGGATADVERFLSNAVGLVNDIGQLFAVEGGTFEQVMNRDDVPAELKERLSTVLVKGMDPERQRELSTSELAMARLKWFLIVEGSRGRVSLQEMKEVGNITDVNTFFTSQLRAKGRIRASLREIENANGSIMRSIKLLRPEASFDSKGRLSVGEIPSIQSIQPEAAAPGQPQVQIQPEKSPVEALRDKDMTASEAIRAAKAAAMSRVGRQN
jgi:hypothetical protein